MLFKRAFSWLCVLAGAVGAMFAFRQLPGGEPLSELRWHLRGQPLAAQYQRADRILAGAEARRSGARQALLLDLLRTDDVSVRQNALLLVNDLLLHEGDPDADAAHPDRSLAVAIFSRWFNQLSDAERVPLLRALYERSGPTFRRYCAADLAARRRWIIAGTYFRRGFYDRSAWLRLAGRALPKIKAERLRYLEQGGAELSDAQHPRTWSSEPAPDFVVELLDDPIVEVRIGAARIMAVRGDARGLAAIDDWLKRDPRAAKDAETVLSAMFGPEWKSRIAAATSQPSR